MKTLKLVFKSLINNDACIEGARKEKKSWVACLLGFLSVIFAVLPIFVSAAKTKGDAIISQNSYGCEVGLTRFVEFLKENNVDLIVKGEGKEKYLDLSTVDDTITGKLIYEHTADASSGKKDFVVYTINTDDDKTFASFVSYVSEQELNPVQLTEELDPNIKHANYLILGKHYIYFGLFTTNPEASSTNFSGDYNHFENGYNLKEIGTVTTGDNSVIPSNTANAEEHKQYIDGVFSNWRDFFLQSYKTNKNRQIWMQTGIFAGISAALMLLIGFMLWIVTRGKTNPCRIYTFWDNIKIGFWAAFCPSLLTAILGLIFADFAMMGFVMFMGFRVMWMSMRNLRPVQ